MREMRMSKRRYDEIIAQTDRLIQEMGIDTAMVANPDTELHMRMMKGDDGKYLWQPDTILIPDRWPLSLVMPRPTFCGYPIGTDRTVPEWKVMEGKEVAPGKIVKKECSEDVPKDRSPKNKPVNVTVIKTDETADELEARLDCEAKKKGFKKVSEQMLDGKKSINEDISDAFSRAIADNGEW
jgi:hypothetical protein